MAVRVRFAPSPTGFLHVGGARTAIFNWLFARREGGIFVLRIEDTDRQRSSDEMVRAILDGMAWLGMAPDEGPFFQSRARERHVDAARRLLADGKAYRCFCSAESIRAARESAQKTGQGFGYPRTCRGLDRAESERRAEAGEPFAVRFDVPPGEVAWRDRVHGRTVIGHDAIEDFVLLRSDGSPTYMLSVVSDDVEMEITHVIRGDDHLSNTPKQILLYRALGANEPEFAHLPLILGTDKKRLSKRHGAVSVLEYRERGYLPSAMFNFLALLGWSPDDDRQRMDRDEMIAAFSLEGVGKSGAVFDLAKLEWLNGQYLMDMPVETIAAEVKPRLAAAGLWEDGFDGERREWFHRLLGQARPRMRTLDDVVELTRPFLEPGDEIEYDEKALGKHLKGDAAQHLARVRERLADVAPWEAAPLEEALRGLATELEVGAGKLIHPTRLAVTGRGASFGIFEVLALLGRERSLRRIDRLLQHRDAHRGGAAP